MAHIACSDWRERETIIEQSGITFLDIFFFFFNRSGNRMHLTLTISKVAGTHEAHLGGAAGGGDCDGASIVGIMNNRGGSGGGSGGGGDDRDGICGGDGGGGVVLVT